MTERRRPDSLPRSISTLGIAVFGPLALFTGIWVFGLILAGPPPWLVVVFLGSLGATVVFTLTYAAVDAAERGRSPD